MPGLHDYLAGSARRVPDRIAVEDPGVAEVSYRGLDRLSGRIAKQLEAAGVRPGDRVGLAWRKSIDTVAAIFGIQRLGAAHVPVDPRGPTDRAALIFRDCGVRAALVEAGHAGRFAAALGDAAPALLAADFESGPLPSQRGLAGASGVPDSPPGPTDRAPGDLGYILYTSGSTGRPKGVTISQRAAQVFVDWCSDTFAPREDDRFSSHAPFHFDLSVLDVYLPLKHGATLVLVSEANGKDPVTLAGLIAERRITSWYSTPSVLALLTQFGRLERQDASSLRMVHFAGEVFPIKHLRRLRELLPAPRYFNLYGPTETNVCTWYEIPSEIPLDQTEPFPIGRPCPHYAHRVVGEDEQDVPRGEEGELWIAGDGLMTGYWNAPERDAEVFRSDAGGRRWYRTGDVVSEGADRNLVFVGRRDRMIKKRGFRVELGEIEQALYRHAEVREVAVVATGGAEDGVRVRAFLAWRGGKPSTIALKQYCAGQLPDYMIPDQFTVLDALPKTSTDKIDYQALKRIP